MTDVADEVEGFSRLLLSLLVAFLFGLGATFAISLRLESSGPGAGFLTGLVGIAIVFVGAIGLVSSLIGALIAWMRVRRVGWHNVASHPPHQSKASEPPS